MEHQPPGTTKRQRVAVGMPFATATMQLCAPALQDAQAHPARVAMAARPDSVSLPPISTRSGAVRSCKRDRAGCGRVCGSQLELTACQMSQCTCLLNGAVHMPDGCFFFWSTCETPLLLPTSIAVPSARNSGLDRISNCTLGSVQLRRSTCATATVAGAANEGQLGVGATLRWAASPRAAPTRTRWALLSSPLLNPAVPSQSLQQSSPARCSSPQ